MPIPLGILAAAGFRPPAAAGSYDLLQTISVGTAVASVEFTNLNATYGSTYRHLQIRIVGSTNSGENWNIMYLNGDTGNSYSRHELRANGSSVQSFGGSYPGMLFGIWNGSNGASVIDILDAFQTTKFKTIRTLSGFIGAALQLTSGSWRNTNAINTISVGNESAQTYRIGTRVSLYGIKATA